jgi:ketosteroid isomerase-like protein
VGENADIVRRLFAAFARRDLGAVEELCASDMEFVPMTLGIAGREEPYRGGEGMRRYFDDVARLWQELRAEPHAYYEVGERVAAVGRVYAWGVGRVIDSPAGWVWRLHDGLVVHGQVFDTRRAALESVGIREGEEPPPAGS